MQNEEITERSISPIYQLNIIEIFAGILIGVLMLLSFRHSILGLEPYTTANEYQTEWFLGFRADLLKVFGWFFFASGFLATISLIRFIRQQHHFVPGFGYISPIGYLTLIWPILFVIPDLHILLIFTFCLWGPLIPIISIIIYALSNKQHNNHGYLLPVLLNIAAFVPFIIYGIGVSSLITD